MARPFHGNVVKCILEVHRTAPQGFHDASGNVGDRLHFERGLDKNLVEGGNVDDEAIRAILLGDHEGARIVERDNSRVVHSPDELPGEKDWNEFPDQLNLRRIGKGVKRRELRKRWGGREIPDGDLPS